MEKIKTHFIIGISWLHVFVYFIIFFISLSLRCWFETKKVTSLNMLIVTKSFGTVKKTPWINTKIKGNITPSYKILQNIKQKWLSVIDVLNLNFMIDNEKYFTIIKVYIYHIISLTILLLTFKSILPYRTTVRMGSWY